MKMRELNVDEKSICLRRRTRRGQKKGITLAIAKANIGNSLYANETYDRRQLTIITAGSITNNEDP